MSDEIEYTGHCSPSRETLAKAKAHPTFRLSLPGFEDIWLGVSHAHAMAYVSIPCEYGSVDHGVQLSDADTELVKGWIHTKPLPEHVRALGERLRAAARGKHVVS